MLQVLPVVVGGEGVHLDPKGDPLLPAMLPGGELGADAVHLRRRVKSENTTTAPTFSEVEPCQYLDEGRGVLLRIPEELDGVEVQRVCVRLQNPHRERDVCNDFYFSSFLPFAHF